MLSVSNSPAVTRHRHAQIRRLPVQARGLLHVFLTANALCVAVSGLRERIAIAPAAGNFIALQRKRLVLLATPAVHVADAEFVDGEGELGAVGFVALRCASVGGEWVWWRNGGGEVVG